MHATKQLLNATIRAIGFQPTESVVVTTVDRTDKPLMVVRVDIADTTPETSLDGIITTIERHVDYARTRAIHIFVFTEAPIETTGKVILRFTERFTRDAAPTAAWHVNNTTLSNYANGDTVRRGQVSTEEAREAFTQWEILVTHAQDRTLDLADDTGTRAILDALEDIWVRDAIVMELLGADTDLCARVAIRDARNEEIRDVLMNGLTGGMTEPDPDTLAALEAATQHLDAHADNNTPAATATLRGLLAWRADQAQEAMRQLDRARAADLTYSLAGILREVVATGLRPAWTQQGDPEARTA